MIMFYLNDKKTFLERTFVLLVHRKTLNEMFVLNRGIVIVVQPYHNYASRKHV